MCLSEEIVLPHRGQIVLDVLIVTPGPDVGSVKVDLRWVWLLRQGINHKGF
jgi:hypothetical protein